MKKIIIRPSIIASLFLVFVITLYMIHKHRVEEDRIWCLHQMIDIQRTARTHFAMVVAAEIYTKEDIIGDGEYQSREPICPSGGTYTLIEGPFPEVGTTIIKCSIKEHNPKDHSDW